MKVIDNRRRQGVRLSEIQVGEAFEIPESAGIVDSIGTAYIKTSQLNTHSAFDLGANLLLDIPQDQEVCRVKASVILTYPDPDIPTNGGG